MSIRSFLNRMLLATAITFLMFSIVGCVAVYTAALPRSDYLWWGNSSNSYSEFIDRMRQVNPEIKTDEFGSHYVSVSKDGKYFGQMVIAAPSEPLLRNAFKTSSGILEPVYRIDMTGTWTFDKNATRALHDFLVAAKFRMQPIEKTEEIARNIEIYLKKLKVPFETGNLVRHNAFYNEVLKSVAGTSAFYVHDGSLTDYARSKAYQMSPGTAGLIVRNVNYAAKLYILETESIANGKADNFAVLMNGAHCGSTNIAQFNAVLENVGKSEYVSLPDAIEARRKTTEQGLKFCTEAFAKYQFTRKIESQKL